MRSTVGSVLVCALFTLGCEEASPPAPPTNLGDWRGGPGAARPDVPSSDATGGPEMPEGSPPLAPGAVGGWKKLPPLPTHLPPKFIVGRDGRPLVLHTHAEAIAGQTLLNLDVSRYDGQGWVRLPAVSETDSAHHGNAVALQGPSGPQAFPPAANWDARIAFGPDGAAFAAWTDVVEAPTMRVVRWNGTAWDPLPGFDLDATPSVLIELIVDASRTLWAVWTDEGGTRVNVAKSRD